MIAFLTALAVTASPYPPPLSIRDTPELKFATGTLEAVDPWGVVLATDAGPFEVQTGQAVVLDEDRRERVLRAVAIGRTLNVWYVVGDGAVAREIDLVTPLPPPQPPLPDLSVKSATGQVERFDADFTHLVLLTQAGPVTFSVDHAGVFGRDHHARALRKLPVGTWVTITYVVDGGARASRIDFARPPAPEPVG